MGLGHGGSMGTEHMGMGMGGMGRWGWGTKEHGDRRRGIIGMEGMGTWGWGRKHHGDRERGVMGTGVGTDVGMGAWGTDVGMRDMGRGGWGRKEHGDRRCVWGHGGLGDVGLGHKRAWGQIAWGRGAKAQPGDLLWDTVGTKHGGQAMGPGPQAGGDANFATTPHPVTSSARPDASLHPPRGGPCPLPYKSGTVTALGAAHAGPGGGIGARKGDGAFGAFTLEPTDGRRCSPCPPCPERQAGERRGRPSSSPPASRG